MTHTLVSVRGKQPINEQHRGLGETVDEGKMGLPSRLFKSTVLMVLLSETDKGLFVDFCSEETAEVCTILYLSSYQKSKLAEN